MQLHKPKNALKEDCDYLVIGAGIFGLYAAMKLTQRKGSKIIVLERDPQPFARGSYINQARVHNGYHYPRSKETAKVASKYYDRFVQEFSFAINSSFTQIYAIASKHSRVTPEEFEQFCNEVHIPLSEVEPDDYFRKGTIEAAYKTRETSFDYSKIRNFLLSKIEASNVHFHYSSIITSISHDEHVYRITLQNGKIFESPFVLNVSYSGVNQVMHSAGLQVFAIKYELCEMVLAKPSINLKSLGVTVMDGLFFSTMPFGGGQNHSLSSVRHTPHIVSYENLPSFACQRLRDDCSSKSLANCNTCAFKPISSWNEMMGTFESFMKPEYSLTYSESLFSIKPILLSSESDDSRPTVIVESKKSPRFVSVLSGKISTVFDLDGILEQALHL